MPVRIVVDNRARVLLEGLPGGARLRIEAAFEYENPTYRKNGALTGEPEIIRTHVAGTRPAPVGAVEELLVPRGGMHKVREVLREAGLAFEVEDARTWEHPEPGFPEHRLELRDYQRELVDAAIARQNCLLRAPTGCLVGDTAVFVNRAGKGSKMRLDHVVAMFGGATKHGKAWDQNIPTFVRAPFADGTVRLDRLIGAKESGVQPVYSMELSGGARIVATADHRMLTPFGWVALDGLREGAEVLCDGGHPKYGGAQWGRKPKPWYKLRTLREHPHAGCRGARPDKGGWTVPVHRLVAEASENGMSLEAFVVAVRRGAKGLVFLDPKAWVVHHKDEDTMNNDPANLEIVTHEEHHRLHRDGSIRNVFGTNS